MTRQMLTLGCRFHLGAEELAQIISHGLVVDHTDGEVITSGEVTGHHNARIGRPGWLRWAREFVREHGLWQICWCEDATVGTEVDANAEAEHAAIRAKARSLVALHFPDLITGEMTR